MCMTNQNWTFKNTSEDRPFLKLRKPLSPEGKSGANPMGSTWQSFQFNMWMRNQNWTFKITYEDRTFLKPRNLHPPKGSALALPMGSNWFLLILIIYLDNENCGFKNTNEETTLFPHQTFIPRREMRSISCRGPIVFTYVLSPQGRCEGYPVGGQLFLLMFYFGLVNVLWKKKGHPSSVILSEFFPRNVLFEGMGWGRVGWVIKSVL